MHLDMLSEAYITIPTSSASVIRHYRPDYKLFSQMTARSVGDECEYFISSVFNKKIEMPIDKAKTTLSRLGLVTEKAVDGEAVLQAVPCSQAYEILRRRWNCLLTY